MRILLVPILVATFAAPVAAQLEGAFTLGTSDKDTSNRVQLNLVYNDGHSNYGRMVERTALTDVVRTGDRITFALRREPGTFSFEGRGSLDRAAGWYGFAGNAEFRQQLEKLGFRNVDPKALFVFALDDLTVARVRQLQQLVSNPLDTAELVRMINHGAGFSYVQAMSGLGFKSLTSDQYRRARDHGVSESYVREMADLGMKLSLEDLIRTRDHGVSAEYVREMRSAGFTVSHEELVRARDHGVSAEFLRRMRGFGYDKLPLGEYIRMRDHGVTPDYVQSMRELGYSNLTANELVRMKDHGVTANYVRRVKELMKESPSAEQLIRMRSHGDFGSR
jgi:ribosomal protein L7Ae-like RNA K-turn-binding protein